MNIVWRYIAFCIATLSVGAAELPTELVKKLRATIQDCCPDAQIQISNQTFTAKNGTMNFTLHSISKTGEIFPQTYQTEGPNFKGFILTVSWRDGRYLGAAMVPQTLQGPYFPTFIDAPPAENGKGHYWVRFSYGHGFDEKARSAIFNALPKTRRLPMQSLSETNVTRPAAGSNR